MFGIGIVAEFVISTTLEWLRPITGPSFGAGKMGLGRPGRGDSPSTGFRGAAVCVTKYAEQGPGEHQASLTSDMAIALDIKVAFKLRVVMRFYFRLRQVGTLLPLLFS